MCNANDGAKIPNDMFLMDGLSVEQFARTHDSVGQAERGCRSVGVFEWLHRCAVVADAGVVSSSWAAQTGEASWLSALAGEQRLTRRSRIMLVPVGDDCSPRSKKGVIMRHPLTIWTWLGLLTLPVMVHAQSTYDMGKTLYQDNCASCHGASGTGDGPLRAYLVKAPSDLTTITRRHNGTFPHQRVWEIIDGRANTQTGPHGSQEMPVWGNEFKAQAERAPWWGMGYGGMHRGGPEWQVHQKISALVDYLVRIQAR